MYYTVINYSDAGHETLRRTERSLGHAYEAARETPHSAVDHMSDTGWVMRTEVFMPQHPVPGPDAVNGIVRNLQAYWASRGVSF